MNRFARLLIVGLALMALSVFAPHLPSVFVAIGVFTSAAVIGWEILQEILSLVGFRQIGLSASARFAAPLTGEPERTAFA